MSNKNQEIILLAFFADTFPEIVKHGDFLTKKKTKLRLQYSWKLSSLANQKIIELHKGIRTSRSLIV